MNETINPQFGKEKIKELLINFIVPLICLGVSVVLIFLIVLPSYNEMPKLKDELSKKNTLKQDLTKKSLLLKKLIDFKAMLDENSTLVDKVLVSEGNVPQLLDEVNQMATSSGLKVARLSYSYGDISEQKEGEKPPYNKVNVSLATEGSYDQVILLMQSIENAARVAYATGFRYSLEEESKNLYATFSIESPYLFVKSDAVTDDPLTLDITSPSFVDFINRIKGLKYYGFINPNIKVEETKQTTESSPSIFKR